MPGDLELTPEMSEQTQTFITTLLSDMGFPSVVSTKISDQQIIVNIDNETDTGRLIGRGGATLKAIQLLIQTMLYRKYKRPIRVHMDIRNYEQRHEEALKAIVDPVIDTVILTQLPKGLPPMSARDRQFVHERVKSNPTLESMSTGDEPNRYVTIQFRGI